MCGRSVGRAGGRLLRLRARETKPLGNRPQRTTEEVTVQQVTVRNEIDSSTVNTVLASHRAFAAHSGSPLVLPLDLIQGFPASFTVVTPMGHLENVVHQDQSERSEVHMERRGRFLVPSTPRGVLQWFSGSPPNAEPGGALPTAPLPPPSGFPRPDLT